MTIRPETPADIEAIYHVETSAFGRAGEADLVDALRSKGVCTLSLVAEIENQIVGHIFFSLMSFQPDEDENSCNASIIGLGPLAVLPEYQKRGVGSALVRETLRQLRESGHEAIALLGNPAYYGRFGFVPASNYNLRCKYDVPVEAFQILELRPGALQNHRGLLLFRPEFDSVE
ncbi:MAG TPA: N-acetyltransferase [Abditibacteriaceae bacterium]|jgi:putative acetyltransferase